MNDLVLDKLLDNKPFVINSCFEPNHLTWVDIENYLNDYLHHSMIEIIDNQGRKIPLFKKPVAWGMSFDINFIFDKILSGCSFVLVGMNRHNKKLNDVCNLVEEYINGFADIHVYAGLSSNSCSFPIHKDKPNNLIMQIEGNCDWEVFTDLPVKENDVPTISITLSPGDLLYIPKQVYHRCRPRTKRISLSIPFTKGQPSNRTWYKLCN